MRPILIRVLGVTLLLVAASTSFAGEHIEANNCEIFVDKVKLSFSSHGSTTITPFIKILPQRLDGEVREVGIRSSSTVKGQSGGKDGVQPWIDQRLESASPVNDYFTSPWGVMVGSDFGSSDVEAVFYVITSKGTTYWAKSESGNFRFNRDVFHGLWNQASGSMPTKEIPTQLDWMKSLNPGRCY